MAQGLLAEPKSQQPRSSLLPMSDEKGLLGAMGLGLGEITRREFLKRSAASVGVPRIPFQGLESLIKEIPLDLEGLYRHQTKLKKLIIQYLGSTVTGGADAPGGFGGIQHTLDSPEAVKAGDDYFNRLMEHYRKITDKMGPTPKPDAPSITRDQDWRRWASMQAHVEAGMGNIGRNKVSGPAFGEMLDETVTRVEKETEPRSLARARKAPAGWSEITPVEIVDRPTNYKTWHEVEKELRDDLLKQEKTTGRTLVTRSGGRGVLIPIGSTLPGTVPTPKPKKLEGPEGTTRPVPEEPERTTRPRPIPEEPARAPGARITRPASPPVQLPSGRDISRMALRTATTAAGWPLYAASFGIPTARSGESRVLAELADQPGVDMDAALRAYRQGLAQEQQELATRRADMTGLLMSGMP